MITLMVMCAALLDQLAKILSSSTDLAINVHLASCYNCFVTFMSDF